MIRCNKDEPCRYSWPSMLRTGDKNVKVCPQCQQNVQWVDSYVAFKEAAQNSQCIAFEPTDVLLAAERVRPKKEEPKQFLLLHKQKLSLKQLAHIKKYIHHGWSFRQLRDAYHNRESIIKYDSKDHDVERVAEVLCGVGIEIEAKREHQTKQKVQTEPAET